MKIKNESIVIRNGKKKIELTNLILDAYLNQFADSQISTAKAVLTKNRKFLNYCLLKFDTPLTDYDETSRIPNEQFSICLMDGANVNQVGNEKKVTIQYDYVFNVSSSLWDYENKDSGMNLSQFYNKKITAIGFNVWWTPTIQDEFEPVCAILDVSDYNIYLQENQEFSITRKDVIETDIEFYSPSDKIKYPVHIAPKNIENLYLPPLAMWKYWDDVAYPILYSIGFSNEKDKILEEHIIANDEMYCRADTNKLYINNVNILESVPRIFLPHFLSFTPQRSAYKYIVLKYKIYQQLFDNSGEDITSTMVDSGYYYHCIMPITEYGKKSIVISYERRN